jgi:hypothetical protein
VYNGTKIAFAAARFYPEGSAKLFWFLIESLDGRAAV